MKLYLRTEDVHEGRKSRPESEQGRQFKGEVIICEGWG